MPRKPDERIEQAKQMYLDGMKLIDIARQLDLPEGTVRRWKSTHKWENERSDKKEANVRKKRKRGGQPGNHNATGPPRNRHAEKHGFFTKWLPEETLEIIGEMPEDPLDALWDQIQLQYAAIIRAQKLMYVKDQNDKTIEKIGHKDGDSVIEERWEVQQAWDKQANFLKAQSRAIGTFLSLVKQYDELIHKNWDLATEEQRERIKTIKAQRMKLENHEEDDGEQVVIINDADGQKENDTAE